MGNEVSGWCVVEQVALLSYLSSTCSRRSADKRARTRASVKFLANFEKAHRKVQLHLVHLLDLAARTSLSAQHHLPPTATPPG